MNTIDTTRIYGEDSYTLAVQASRVAFPLGNVPWKPSAAILCSVNDYRFAFALASLIHHPIGAPMLFVDHMMPAVTRQELLRLMPSGENAPAQVILAGDVSATIEDEVKRLGFTVSRVGNTDPAHTAYATAQLREDISRKSNMKLKGYFVVSGEHYVEASGVPGYSAHTGTPVFFVGKNFIPDSLRHWIQAHPTLPAYVIGSDRTISEQVVIQIRHLSKAKVTRIAGKDPFEATVRFAEFHDAENNFGWNRNAKGRGDAFTFVPFQSWHHIITGMIFSHMGKHTPTLAIQPNQVPSSVAQYISMLRPEMSEPPMPPFMHGFVIGSFRDITFNVQVQLERLMLPMMGSMDMGKMHSGNMSLGQMTMPM